MSTRKALPLAARPEDVATLGERRPALSTFPTPLVTLSDAAVRHNIDTMARWTRAHGVGLAPHGKTTMSRELWQRQLDAGAWGITVATPWQLSMALDWGVPRVMLANALVQPDALRAIAPRLDAAEVVVWADSLRAVEIMDDALAGAKGIGRLGVLVELGAPGGRTGARTRAEARSVAAAVGASPRLRVAGVAGYEGALAHAGDEASLRIVRSYVGDLVSLHDELESAGLYPDAGRALITAGGSAYFDIVVDVLADRADPDGVRGRAIDVVLRSGAYITHDDGFYRGIAPLSRAGGGSFRSAIHGWATVVSRPEPGLALVDAGKRDLPFDEGLPEPQALRRFGAADVEPLHGAEATAMNDQHTFVRVPEEAGVQVGDVIRFGLSHPCTTFDKWGALPLVDDVDSASPRVIGLVETAFG
ncbi:alanine racemase [Microbacterium betulae]|uniref:Alanine racemase n=1 Tax=Microbacterium betulae TaxID=2981139 RepID=A0AA97FHS2_9MICO|nr:alanine racemase [Microbacterium sp. AB]WOF22314.1 alanine racemase [Microbacterium sp. AB]